MEVKSDEYSMFKPGDRVPFPIPLNRSDWTGKEIEKTDKFIERSRQIHGSKYSYVVTKYIENTLKVFIFCFVHGVFEQSPKNHKRSGCPKCGGSAPGNTELFIINSKKINGDLYNYDKTVYVNSNTKVIITCRIHGDFLQKPPNHLYGQGCFECFGYKRKTTEQFIENSRTVHGDLYSYDKTIYVNNHTKVIITCKIHGDFLQVPNMHVLQRNGCPTCGGNARKDTKSFIIDAKNIHGDLYGYDKTNYINKLTHVIITCKKHGDFNQTPNDHLGRCGCPLCINKTEAILKEYLTSKYDIIYQPKFEWCKISNKLRFDYLIPEFKLIIELDGLQHFKQSWRGISLEELQYRDRYKERCASENNYSMIRIFQSDVWNDKNDWKGKLLESIKHYNEPTLILIGNRYKELKINTYKTIMEYI